MFNNQLLHRVSEKNIHSYYWLYLVKLIARVLSPYITYFSIQVVDENDCERVLLLKEDSFNMNSWCNSVVATVQSDFAV